MTLTRRSGLAAMITAGLAGPARAADAAGLEVQRLAWAGVRFRVGGVALFVDAVAPDPEAGTPGPALAADAARAFALVTHHHGDHCSPKDLAPVLGPRGYMTAFEDSVRLFDTRTVQVQPARMHEPVFLSRSGGEFAAWCVPAADGFGGPQVSWVVDGGGRRILHAGDTLWHGHWWDIARAYGPFDAVFLPINGLRQIQGRFTDAGEAMGLTPEQAAAAAKVLRARLAVPIHYGSKGDPTYVETPDAERRFLAAAARLGIKTRVLQPGDIFTL